MAVSPVNLQPVSTAQAVEKTDNITTSKVKSTAQAFFKKAIFWSVVAVGVIFSFSIIKAAFSNPITAIALCAIGIWGYKNRSKISSYLKMNIAAIKEKLGISSKENFYKINDKIILGPMPTHSGDYFKALKDAQVKTVLSIMHHDQSLYTTMLSKPILPHEFTKQDIDYLPIKIANPKQISIEEMHIIADMIHERAQEGKKVFVHGDLDSSADHMGILAYFIKYQNSSLQEALHQLKAVKKDAELSDECLGRLYKFSLAK